MHVLEKTLISLTALLLVGCPEDGEEMDTGSETDSGDSETGGECPPSDIVIPPLDVTGCMPAANDYTPTVNGSADDTWPECANDDGVYHPFEQPSSAARTDALEMMRTIFASDTSPAGFTAAREQYALAEGIESRVVRREDIHYPEIAMADQDPTVEFDKQCTVPTNVTKYPDRCAGPAKISPLINEAFEMGQTGVGDPLVNAAKIDAAVVWFMHLSVVKEAIFSCAPADYSGDCDAAWGYYNGAQSRTAGLGYGADVTGASAVANERLFDGLSAMRCWRDGYPADMDADTDDPLFSSGSEQLDRANNHAAAVVLRARMEDQLMACGSEADANWAWVQTFAGALVKPAQDTDAAQAGVLASVLANAAPMPEDVQAGIAALDALFPCP